MKITTILMISLFILIGCRSLNEPITEEEFLNDTTIEYVLYDADIMNWDAFYTEYMSNNKTTFDLIEITLNNIDTVIDEYNYIQLTDTIDISLYSIQENSRFFLIPVFNTWTFDDIDLQYSYIDGQLVFSISPIISNFPATTLKFLFIQIDSPHIYQVALG